MYAYVLHNSCCTCLFDCTFFVIICDFFISFVSWSNKKDTMTKKKKGEECTNITTSLH